MLRQAISKRSWVAGKSAIGRQGYTSVPRDREVAGRRWSLVATDGEVYAWLKRDGELTALYIASGRLLTRPGHRRSRHAGQVPEPCTGRRLGIRRCLPCPAPNRVGLP
jgi:hypothetical protein